MKNLSTNDGPKDRGIPKRNLLNKRPGKLDLYLYIQLKAAGVYGLSRHEEMLAGAKEQKRQKRDE